MENCSGVRRCLICRRVALKRSSVDSEKLVSNASLLQDFLNCFHANVLESEVHDLSTSCHFCPTCEQFIAEYGSIQTQMTQLTRRAAHLKATLSALLLSAHELLERNLNEDVTEIINKRIQNSQEIQLALLIQQTVDDIRDELQKKYSVRVMLDKIRLPWKQNLDVLPVSYDDVDEASDREGSVVADDTDVEHLPSEGVSDDEVTPAHLLKTEEEANSYCSSSQDSVDSTEMSFKARNTRKRKRNEREAIIIGVGLNRFKYKEMSFQRNEEDKTYTCDACGFKSARSTKSIRHHLDRHLRKKDLTARSEKEPVMIPNGPNRFKYNGYDVRFNDQDHCYYCGACHLKGRTSVQSILNHIRNHHYTAEDKIKFTAIKQSDTEWLYGGKYKIIKMEEKKFKCVSCGSMKTRQDKVVAHIRSKHMELEGPDEVIPLPETDTPTFNILTHLAVRSQKQPVMIPSEPNQFKYNGYNIWFNDEDQYYDCGSCDSTRHASISSVQNHIRLNHYTAEDKIKFTSIKLSDTEWMYGGKYKIIKMEGNKFRCVLCGSMKNRHDTVVAHIRSRHVELEGPDKVNPLTEPDTPTCNVLTHHSDHFMSDNSQLPLVLKLETLPTDNATADETWDQGECNANIQVPFVPKIEPLWVGESNDDVPWDHSEFVADGFDEKYLPEEVELNNVETSEQISRHIRTRRVDLERPDEVDPVIVSDTSSVNNDSTLIQVVCTLQSTIISNVPYNQQYRRHETP